MSRAALLALLTLFALGAFLEAVLWIADHVCGPWALLK